MVRRKSEVISEENATVDTSNLLSGGKIAIESLEDLSERVQRRGLEAALRILEENQSPGNSFQNEALNVAIKLYETFKV